MPYSYNINGVIDCARLLVENALISAGEAPTTLGMTYNLEQYSFDENLLPLTFFEIKNIIVEERQINNYKIRMPVTIHHAREREAASEAEAIAVERLSSIALAIEQDRRLRNVGGDTIPVHDCLVHEICFGSENRLRETLEMTDLNVSVGCASMDITLEWWEMIDS